MIIKEFFRKRKDGINLYINYSNENFKLKQIETGNIYDKAIDVEISNFHYEETNLKIEKEDDEVKE